MLSDLLDDGVSIDDAYEITEDTFDDAYAEAAAVLIEMDELEAEEEEVIYAALDVLYTDLEAGMTLTEALEANADLYDACEMSTDLQTALDDIYEAIEAGSTVEEAFLLYEDDLEEAVSTAAYLITDVAIQIIEESVQTELFAEQIEDTLANIYASLAAGETL
jgi:type II secretory pathway component PulF